jgi:hypothetical protein
MSKKKIFSLLKRNIHSLLLKKRSCRISSEDVAIAIECEHVYGYRDPSSETFRMFNQSNHWFDDRRRFDLLADLQSSIYLLVDVPSTCSFAALFGHSLDDLLIDVGDLRHYPVGSSSMLLVRSLVFIVVLSNRRFHQLFQRLFSHFHVNDDLIDSLQHC